MTGCCKEDKECTGHLIFLFLMTSSVKEGKEFKIKQVYEFDLDCSSWLEREKELMESACTVWKILF